jgi:hypothetical protein
MESKGRIDHATRNNMQKWQAKFPSWCVSNRHIALVTLQPEALFYVTINKIKSQSTEN